MKSKSRGRTTPPRSTPLRALVPAAVLLALGGPLASSAAAQAESSGSSSSPTEVIRQRNQAVREILETAGDSLEPATREELKDVLNEFIDFRELSRRSLDRYWDERTPEEKRRFVDVFRDLIRSSSVKKLGVHRADSVSYGEPEITDGQAVVRTVAHRGDRSVEIVYRMHRDEDEWKAYDIVIDGASTVRTYRDSFRREISETSYEAMFERLAERAREESGRAGQR